MSNLFWLTKKPKLANFLPSFSRAMAVRGWMTGGFERLYLHQLQSDALVRCNCRLWSAEDALQPMKAMVRHGRLRPDDEGLCLGSHRTENCHEWAAAGFVDTKIRS